MRSQIALLLLCAAVLWPLAIDAQTPGFSEWLLQQERENAALSPEEREAKRELDRIRREAEQVEWQRRERGRRIEQITRVGLNLLGALLFVAALVAALRHRGVQQGLERLGAGLWGFASALASSFIEATGRQWLLRALFAWALAVVWLLLRAAWC